MFKSTGNNFGAPEITFQDYQNEHEIVLNAAFEFSADNDDYKTAKVLEIYVPDLSLKKSAITSIRTAGKRDGSWAGTVVKCWIKNRNTICIEKLDLWDECPEHKIWFCSMFATRGHKGIEFDLMTRKSVSLQHSGPLAYLSSATYLETENWAFLCFQSDGVSWKYEGLTDQITNYTPFPDDIDVILPFVPGLFKWNKPGPVIIDAHWHDSVIDISPLPSGFAAGTGYDGVFYAFVVRHTATPKVEEPEDDGLTYEAESIVNAQSDELSNLSVSYKQDDNFVHVECDVIPSLESATVVFHLENFPSDIPSVGENIILTKVDDGSAQMLTVYAAIENSASGATMTINFPENLVAGTYRIIESFVVE